MHLKMLIHSMPQIETHTTENHCRVLVRLGGLENKASGVRIA